MKWVFALLALTQAMHGKGKKNSSKLKGKERQSRGPDDESKRSKMVAPPKTKGRMRTKAGDDYEDEVGPRYNTGKTVAQINPDRRSRDKQVKKISRAEDDEDLAKPKELKKASKPQSKPAPKRKTSNPLKKEIDDDGDDDGDDDSESEGKDDGPKNTNDKLDDAKRSEIKRKVTAWFKVDDDLLKRLRSLTTTAAAKQVKAALGILENGKYITDAVNALLKFEKAVDKDAGIEKVMTSLTDSFVKSLNQVRKEVGKTVGTKHFFSLERGYALAHSEPPKPVDSSFQQLHSILTERVDKVNKSLKEVRESLKKKKKYAKPSGDDRADEDEYADDDDDEEGDKDE